MILLFVQLSKSPSSTDPLARPSAAVSSAGFVHALLCAPRRALCGGKAIEPSCGPVWRPTAARPIAGWCLLLLGAVVAAAASPSASAYARPTASVDDAAVTAGEDGLLRILISGASQETLRSMRLGLAYADGLLEPGLLGRGNLGPSGWRFDSHAPSGERLLGLGFGGAAELWSMTDGEAVVVAFSTLPTTRPGSYPVELTLFEAHDEANLPVLVDLGAAATLTISPAKSPGPGTDGGPADGGAGAGQGTDEGGVGVGVGGKGDSSSRVGPASGCAATPSAATGWLSIIGLLCGMTVLRRRGFRRRSPLSSSCMGTGILLLAFAGHSSTALAIAGDATVDGAVTMADLNQLVNWHAQPADAPKFLVPPFSDADIDHSLVIDIADVDLMVDFLLERVVEFPPESIQNPHFSERTWKLWRSDPTPVSDTVRTMELKPLDDRLYPNDAQASDPSGTFLVYSGVDAGAGYAGIWDDVYINQDANHSYVRDGWRDDAGINVVTGVRKVILEQMAGRLTQFGANFTSQSTTGMGHDLTNSARSLSTERSYFFSNTLRAGPTHISFMDRGLMGSTDRYEALVATMYNSVGSSSSETTAITKMILAAGYLPDRVKYDLKRNGVYPSALLYLWKAALPYDVPYGNELRHRVAYNSKGDHSDYRGSNQTEVNKIYHNYDDRAHMQAMVELAQSMTVAPPIAILDTLSVVGGTSVYQNKSTLLVRQGAAEDVTVRVSANNSFDLQDLPLDYRWSLLYGEPSTSITPVDPPGTFEITVPSNSALPKGRTTLLLIASNGVFDSNPAVVNIYRTEGADNRRPTMRGMREQTILPGESVSFDLDSVDPEGLPVRFYRWANEVGELVGDSYSWTCPLNTPPGAYPVSIITADGCGSSYYSHQSFITVSTTVAEIEASAAHGPAPLTVAFSAAGSRDLAAGSLSYAWNFDDGSPLATTENPEHTFTEPGFYRVTLRVTGPSGSHETSTVILAEHGWPLALDRGWTAAGIDSDLWQDTGASPPATFSGGFLRVTGGDRVASVNVVGELTSIDNFTPPFYVEVVYNRVLSQLDSGISFLGHMLGAPGDPSGRTRDLALGHDTGAGWQILKIADKIRSPWSSNRIRMMVTADPDNAGKIRLSGYVDASLGLHFFSLANQDALSNKFLIRSQRPGERIDVFDFQVWAPAGNVSRADVRVVAQGMSVYSGQSELLGQRNGGDFGTVAMGGSVSHTFEVHNVGGGPLQLDAAKALRVSRSSAPGFSVTQPLTTLLASGDSTTFTVQFTPSRLGRTDARVNVYSDDPDEPILVLTVNGDSG